MTDAFMVLLASIVVPEPVTPKGYEIIPWADDREDERHRMNGHAAVWTCCLRARPEKSPGRVAVVGAFGQVTPDSKV